MTDEEGVHDSIVLQGLENRDEFVGALYESVGSNLGIYQTNHKLQQQ
jgi:hypothetical protein